MIDIVNCTQHYGIKPVLRDINLHIERGELVALMGPNGMGKSTLLSVMAGILMPSRGYAQIDGKRRRQSVEDEAAIRRMTVYLPAEAWLPGPMSGREWLIGVGRLYEHDFEHLMEHAGRLLELFDLKEIADSKMSSYSSGQRKKIALGGALIAETPVMLLDEPFAGGLDPSGITSLKRVLQSLRDRRETTIVLATPVPELVEDLADRVALIRDGQIVTIGCVDELRQLAQCKGSLGEVYEKLISPRNLASIERYLQGAKP